MSTRALTLAIGSALLITGCDANKVTTANENPNNPTNAPSSALFTSAVRNAAARWLDGVGGTRYAFLSQHMAEVQYPESDAYTRLTASSTSGLFNLSYYVELQDLQLLIDRGEANGQPGLSGPAKIMKSWEFGILTDVFGDVPYSEAFQAGADDPVLLPAYDEQQAIYADLFATLAEASSELGSAQNVLGAGDPIYDGDPASWRRLANSLHARHALRIVNRDPGVANTQLTAALSAAGGLITSNDHNAALPWPGDGIYDSPWANNFKTRDDHRISNRLLTYLRDFDDPRLAVYAMPAEVDQPEVPGQTLRYCPTGAPPCYVGLFNALEHAEASTLLPNTSRVGEIFFPGVTAYGTFGGSGGSFPSYLMTAAEVEFIRAEAAERSLGGLTPAQAAGFYNAGITRSMELFGIPAADIALYLAQPAVNYLTAATTVERQRRIAIQKWLALYIDPIQAWTEFRRTCQPAILEPGPEAIVDEIPRRLQYSTTEKAVNGPNYNAAVARQGADNFLTHVWWDVPEQAPTYQAGCGVR